MPYPHQSCGLAGCDQLMQLKLSDEVCSMTSIFALIRSDLNHSLAREQVWINPGFQVSCRRLRGLMQSLICRRNNSYYLNYVVTCPPPRTEYTRTGEGTWIGPFVANMLPFLNSRLNIPLVKRIHAFFSFLVEYRSPSLVSRYSILIPVCTSTCFAMLLL